MKEEKIKVLALLPMELPKEIELDNTLEAMQNFVGGLIESRQTQISIDLLPLQAYSTQIPIEYETYSVFETILHKLQNEYVHRGNIKVSPLTAVALHVKILAAGCLVTEGLFLIPFFRVCGLIAEKFQLFKGRFAFQHELLPQLAQAHGIAQLAVRDCAVDKIGCKGKIAVICPVANDDICRLIVEVKSV